MNLGVWAAVTALLVKLLGLFRGKGYRADVTIRSEEAIRAEKTAKEKLHVQMVEQNREINTLALQEAKARVNDWATYGNELHRKLQDAKHKYDDLKRRYDALP